MAATIGDFYKALQAPFQTDEVRWRVGSKAQDGSKGQPFAYIDARSVFNRLDAVTGGFGWQCNYSHAGDKTFKTICNLGIYMPLGPHAAPISEAQWGWIWRADGAGDTDFEGDKGAISDAFKRAAVRFGIGRYLYDMPFMWVKLEKKGNSYIIDKTEMPRLKAELDKVSKAYLSDSGVVVNDEKAQETIEIFAQIAAAALKYLPDSETLSQFAQENTNLISSLSDSDKSRFRAGYVSAAQELKAKQEKL